MYYEVVESICGWLIQFKMSIIKDEAYETGFNYNVLKSFPVMCCLITYVDDSSRNNETMSANKCNKSSMKSVKEIRETRE